MKLSKSSTLGSSLQDDEYSKLVDEISARLQIGESVDVDDYCRAHPQYAERLQNLMPTLKVLAVMAGRGETDDLSASLLANQALGDFRLVRQIGRGGMGVVYEAVQLSLNRRVALKVLPFAAMLDPRQLQRFKNEAQAAASLEHPHIVNVFFVGCERGVHFYAMRYVDGQSLAEMLANVHRPIANAQSRIAPDRDTRPMAALTTQFSTDRREYYRSVAQLGIQAAIALEYAHQMAIVHRDIKPSNLMLDSQGQLWVTDFGLAIAQGNANLTMTGDLVGTLRYMSPEQASGKSATVDHRTDIYSMGATLYELLSGRPAFPADDRQSLLHDILHTLPIPLRQIDSSIPVDLQTIVLKSTSKEPHDRYGTARELADDLKRYVEQRPIQARPLGRIARAWRWCRRSPSFAMLAAAAVSLLLLLCIVTFAFFLRERTNRQIAVEQARESRWQQYVSDMHAATAAWEESDLPRAMALLERHRPGPGEPDLRAFEWYYLWNQCQNKGPLQTIDVGAAIWSMAVSPDGQLLATGDNRGRVRFWDVHQWRLVGEIHDGEWIRDVKFSPDGQLVSTTTLWTAKLWNRTTGECLHEFKGHTFFVLKAEFSPDGKKLATGCRDRAARIWDVATGRQLIAITGQGDAVWPIAWQNNETLVTSCFDGSVRSWNVESGNETATIVQTHPQTWPWALVSHDKTMIAVAHSGGILGLGDPHKFNEIDSFGYHELATLTFSKNDQFLATAGLKSRKVIVWDTATRQPVATYLTPARQLLAEFIHDNKTLVTGGRDGLLRLWDFSRRNVHNRDVLCGHIPNVLDVAFDRTGGILASVGAEGTVRIWDVESGTIRHVLRGSEAPVESVVCSPTETNVATTGKDGTVRLWDFTSGALLWAAHIHAGHSWLAYSPDGRYVFSGGQYDGKFQVLDSRDGRLVRWFDLPKDEVMDIDCFPDGVSIAVGSRSGRLAIINQETGIVSSVLQERGHPVDSVACSHDGQMLATGEIGKVATIWDVKSRRPLHTLHHGDNVRGIAFSPDDRIVATAGSDSIIRIWDVATGAERSELRGHGYWITDIAFSPDGQILASAGQVVDPTVRVWRAPMTETTPHGHLEH